MINKKVKVLNSGFVQLVDLMPSSSNGADLAIVDAARLSYKSSSKGEEQDKKLIFHLMKNNHTSPFEQVEFKFLVRLPSMVMAQWVRHRTGSYSISSGRYTAFTKDDFYIPDDCRCKSDLTTDLLQGGLIETYGRGLAMYEGALENNVPKELARLFLPGFAMYYTMYYKTDAHNLMNFLRQRMAKNAQWEIQQYAKVIYEDFFKPSLPWTAEAFEKFKLKNWPI
jgi:thymidylate synthase (FAD)